MKRWAASLSLAPQTRARFASTLAHLELKAMRGWISTAGVIGVASIGMSVFVIGFAFVLLAIAFGFAVAAMQSRRRADSIFARELACVLAEGSIDPTEYAEAA